MRLTSDIWVKALLRRVFSDGLFAVVERQGSPEAGTIFIRVRRRDGLEMLFGPAPQAMFDTAKPMDRVFEQRVEAGSAEEVNAVLDREKNFDPDVWVVELETDEPDRYLSIMPA